MSHDLPDENPTVVGAEGFAQGCPGHDENGWYSMESAPKDGITQVDLWVIPFNGKARRVSNMWWASGMEYWRNDDLSCKIDPAKDWPVVTHWRPAPPPPTVNTITRTKVKHTRSAWFNL